MRSLTLIRGAGQPTVDTRAGFNVIDPTAGTALSTSLGTGTSAPTTPQPVATTTGNTAPTLYGNWTPALFMPYPRSIGGIIAEVTIEENATDDLTITEHPVEQGAPIADHSFKRPSSVTVRAGWSVRGSYDLSAETGVYGLLLSWQAALLPFDVVTGKRRYSNMLMERLVVVTDEKAEYALRADITCRQVIIVGTQTTNVQTTSDSPSNQSDPSSTSSPKDNGDQPASNVGNGGVLQSTSADIGATGEYGVGQSGGADIGASGEYGVGQTPEANQVETQASTNSSPANTSEKGMAPTATLDLGGNVLAPPPEPPTRGVLWSLPGPMAEYQRLVRGLAWQRTSRSQHSLVVRSPNEFRY